MVLKRFCLLGLCIFFIWVDSISQKIELHLNFGSIISKIITERDINHIVENKAKPSYGFKISGSTNLNSSIKTGISIGYLKLGGLQYTNAGYSQNNPEIFGSYTPWSVVKYKDHVKLNYYSISFTGSYSIHKNIQVGLNVNNLLMADNSLKREVYISNFEANYAETIWYKNKNSNFRKYNFAPEIFIGLDASSNANFQLSYLHSLNSIYTGKKAYNNSFNLGINYKIL